jgi:hypothetical protein
MIKVKLIEYFCCQEGNYDPSCLIPFIRDNLGWEEVSQSDYINLIAWANSPAGKGYMLVSETKGFSVKDALEQHQESFRKKNEEILKKQQAEKARKATIEQRRKDKEIKKLQELASKYPEAKL